MSGSEDMTHKFWPTDKGNWCRTCGVSASEHSLSGSEDIVGVLRRNSTHPDGDNGIVGLPAHVIREAADLIDRLWVRGELLPGAASGETSTPIGSIAPQGDADSNASLKEQVARLSEQVKDEHTSNILNLQAATVKLNALEAENVRLSEQVEKQGKVVGLGTKVADAISGHHYHTGNNEPIQTPAHSIWGRENPNCDVCQSVYEYRAALNGLVVVGEDGDDVGLPAAERQEPNGRDDPDSARGTVR